MLTFDGKADGLSEVLSGSLQNGGREKVVAGGEEEHPHFPSQ